MDTINSPIKYSFISGTPNSYADYFRIDQEKGTIHQIKAVDTSTTKTFNIIIKVLLFLIKLNKLNIQILFKAQEISEAKRSATAKLIITVKPVDANPPELLISSSEGYVDENSPIGTHVVDSSGRTLKLTVSDKDFVCLRKNYC